MKVNMRNVTACVVAHILILSGRVRRTVKKAMDGEYVLSIYFHNPSKKEFESCVKWLKRNKFNFISMAELDAVIHQQRPFPKGSVLLTADDGWQSNQENIVAVANQYGIPVTIFVATSPVEEGTYWWSYIPKKAAKGAFSHSVKTLKTLSNAERLLKVEEVKKNVRLNREAMTVEQIQNIAASRFVTIAGHTHSHPILPNCLTDEVYQELAVSKQKLELWTGKAPAYFAYPNGSYTKRESKIVEELNYRLAFSTEARYLTPDKTEDKYSLPRFGFLEGASFAENICRVTGVWKTTMCTLKSLVPGKSINKTSAL